MFYDFFSLLVFFLFALQNAEGRAEYISKREPFLYSKKYDEMSDTLVVYVHADTDEEYSQNLGYFLRHGAKPGHGADFIVVVQETSPILKISDSTLFALRYAHKGVKILTHPNECYDWGAFAWTLRHPSVKVEGYKYWIMLNSSVRGPFLHPSIPLHLPWYRLLTNRLGGEGNIHMVGPVISCEGSPHRDPAIQPDAKWRSNPHVQSWALAVDAVGLNVLQAEREVLGCPENRWDAIYHSELGASRAILRAGYNIASLLKRYEGVDWRITSHWKCNNGKTPLGKSSFYNSTLGPYETIFVKFKSHLLSAGDPAALHAKRLSEWEDSKMLKLRHLSP